VALDVTDAAVAWLGEHGYEPEYGRGRCVA
jgi:ATP-dependent Clp protease ATP-binding subunit ClpC